MGGAALLLGAVIALRTPVPDRELGGVMAFGAGVLISAASFDLTAEAYLTGGRDAVSGGLAAGALTFFITNRLINRRRASRG